MSVLTRSKLGEDRPLRLLEYIVASNLVAGLKWYTENTGLVRVRLRTKLESSRSPGSEPVGDGGSMYLQNLQLKHLIDHRREI